MSGLIDTRVTWVGTDNQGTLIRHTQDGAIHSMQKRVKLTAEAGQWYTMGVKNAETGQYEDKKVITAKGYKTLSSVIGITFVTPDTIVDETGKVVGNPYTSKSKGIVDWVKVRMIGVCRGQSGNMQARDLTFVYNFQAYLTASIVGKWHNKKTNQTQSWGRLVNVESAPPCPSDKMRFPVWVGVELEVDLMNPQVVAIMREHQEQQKFVERNAIAMTERNIVQKMTGVHYVGQDDTVLVTIWPQGDTNLPRLTSMIEKAKTGVVRVDDIEVEVVKEKHDAQEEDIATTNENDESSDTEDAEVEPVKVERTKEDALRAFRKMYDEIPVNEEKPDQKKKLLAAALKLHGLKAPADLSKPETTIETIDKVTDSIRVTL